MLLALAKSQQPPGRTTRSLGCISGLRRAAHRGFNAGFAQPTQSAHSMEGGGLAQLIAVDVGGTHCRAALFDGDRIAWRMSVPTPAQEGPEAVVDAVTALLAPWRDDAKLPVGVAVAGFVVEGRVTAHHGLRGWEAFPLGQALSDRLQRTVPVFNDARAAAWGEYRRGAGQGCREFCFVTVSTGVGAGLVLDGRLHLARNGLDAELGETLAVDGRTLEEHASGTALTRRALALGHANASALCDAADSGEPQAEAALRQAVGALAAKLADMSVLLGVARTAVGGGLGLRPGYLARLRSALHSWPALYRHELVPAALGGDAGLHGVAALLSAA